jgi:purine nucleoside permease
MRPDEERRAMNAPARWAAVVLAAASCLAACASQAGKDLGPPSAPAGARPVKLLIIGMFGAEGQVWIDRLGLTEEIAVPGLSSQFPSVRCNADDVCNVITGMGHANAAASIVALVQSRRLDLTQAYFLIAGISGIDPAQGTLGSAAWARYAVSYGIAWELDAREMPPGWKYGYFGINTTGPDQKPPLDYRTEIFQIDEALLQKVLQLSRGASLEDGAEARAFRANFPEAPANQPPSVLQCDTVSSDTWFAGNALGERARDWVKLMTDGAGTYCTTQQEDNATVEALKRAGAAGALQLARLAILRSGSDFDRPYPGQSDSEALVDYSAQGGFVPAIANLYNAGSPWVRDVVARWEAWRGGVPD